MNDDKTDKIQDDEFWIRLIKVDDKQAFEKIFKTYFIPLCRFASIYVKDNRAAEELVLDVFTSVWEKRKQINIKLTLKSYLFQATRNRAMNYLRDNGRFVTISDWSPIERFEVDESYELRELEHLITEAISSLPDRCREIFLISRTEHLSNKEIAEKLNVSVKNIEAQITKALKLIKSYLGDSYSYLW